MRSPSKWHLWLLFFLVMELPAAWDRKPGGTFSEWVWSTFELWWERVLLFTFIAVLLGHLVFGVPGGFWIAFTGFPLAVIVFLEYIHREQNR